jgi:hypothetical protein
VELGGGDGTPAATPHLEVSVRCEAVGTDRSRCTETRVAPTARR